MQIAKVSGNLKEYDKAFKFYKLSHTIFERIYGSKSRDNAECLMEMAKIKAKLN